MLVRPFPRPLLGALFLMLSLVVKGARAEAPSLAEHFSQQHDWMINGQISGYWSDSKGLLTQPDWQLGASPGFAYFVVDRLALGALCGASYAAGRAETTTVSGGPQGYYAIVLGDRVSLLVAVAALVTKNWTSVTLPYIGEQQQDALRFQVGVGLPLLFHVSEHVALGFGPDFRFTQELSAHTPRVTGTDLLFTDDKSTFRLGVASWVGSTF
jgi:hypothetical protein